MVKKRVSFTLDENLMKELKLISDESLIPQSRIVEQALKEKLDKMKADRR